MRNWSKEAINCKEKVTCHFPFVFQQSSHCLTNSAIDEERYIDHLNSKNKVDFVKSAKNGL